MLALDGRAEKKLTIANTSPVNKPSNADDFSDRDEPPWRGRCDGFDLIVVPHVMTPVI